jgi:cell division protease FtsH
LLDPEERHRVAVHEAGHAVVAHFSPHAEPLHRVTIIPRGMALGVTQQTPGADKHIMTEPELLGRLQVLMAGYASEKLTLGNVSTGAENDLKEATRIATHMAARFGMSKKLGAVYYDYESEHPFLGHRMALDGGTSDATVFAIETEARQTLAESERAAEGVLVSHREVLDRLVALLEERETLEREELGSILGPRESTMLEQRPVRVVS